MTKPGKDATMVSEQFVIENPAGLHARPAAEIVERAKALDATVQIRKGDKTANASSIMSLLALGATTGDTVTVVAEGADAASAVAELRTIMQSKES
jgi:phosphotransferase system HPr (HPr) family protein